MKRILIAVAFLVIESSAGSAQTPGSGYSSTKISVFVEIRGSHPAYRVNGKAVSDPLRALGSLWTERTKDKEVEILMDPHATFLQLGEVEGLVSKAGFQHVNTFVYSRSTGLREQIHKDAPRRMTLHL